MGKIRAGLGKLTDTTGNNPCFALLLMLFVFSSQTLLAQVYTIDATHGGSGANTATKGREAGLCAFAVGKNKNRVQYLISDYELQYYFPASGTISHIGFNVVNLNNGTKPLKGVTIKVWQIDNNARNTFKSTTTTMNTTGYTLLVNKYIEELNIITTGWFDIALGSESFFYTVSTGQHLVVEVSNDNTSDRASQNFSISTHKTGSINTMRARYSTDDTNTAVPTEAASLLPNSPSTANNVSAYSQRTNRADIRFTYQCSDHGAGGVAVIETMEEGCVGAPVKLRVNNASNASGLGYQWEWAPSSDTSFDSWIAIPGATSSTYTAHTDIIDKSYRRKTFCLAAGYDADNSVNSTTVEVAAAVGANVYAGGTWSRGYPPSGSTTESIIISDGTYTVNEDITACSCTVGPNANLIVAPGKTLNLTGPIVPGGGTITFENGSSLLQPDGVVNTGHVIYKRNSTPMVKFDFTYWSSPVSDTDSTPFTLGQFSPGTLSDKFYRWNNATQNWQQEGPNTVVVPGRGYIIRSPQDFPTVPENATTFEGQFVGVPHNGSTTAEVAGDGLYSLVGNPFPSSLDADAIINDVWNADRFQGTFYFWTHNSPVASGYANPSDGNDMSYNNDDYALYNLLGGTEGPSARYIGAGQSFMVVGKNSGGAIRLNNSMRTGGADNSSFYRTSANPHAAAAFDSSERHRVWLQLANASNYKQTLVGYAPNATAGIDYGFDGVALTGTGLGFYSLIDTIQLGIQGRGLPFNDADEVPMGFTTNQAGRHIISLYNMDGIFATEGVDVFIQDNVTGVLHNLKEGPYTFATDAGTFNSRFILKYTRKIKDAGFDTTIAANADRVVIYKNQSSLHVNSLHQSIKNINVFDLSGRLLMSRSGVDSREVVLANVNWSPQMIIVQTLTQDNVLVTKKVVL